jgi:hypothetical protein
MGAKNSGGRGVGVGVMLSNSKDGFIFFLSLNLSIALMSKVGSIGEISLFIVSDIVDLMLLRYMLEPIQIITNKNNKIRIIRMSFCFISIFKKS